MQIEVTEIIDNVISAFNKTIKLHPNPEYNKITVEKDKNFIAETPLLVFSNEFSLYPLPIKDEAKIEEAYSLRGSLDFYTKTPYQGADLLSWFSVPHVSERLEGNYSLFGFGHGFGQREKSPVIETKPFFQQENFKLWCSKLFIFIEFTMNSEPYPIGLK